jgi:SWI/SNF-related matrix-associated actin-dependent regulator 1 of chromatin subfamily A
MEIPWTQQPPTDTPAMTANFRQTATAAAAQTDNPVTSIRSGTSKETGLAVHWLSVSGVTRDPQRSILKTFGLRQGQYQGREIWSSQPKSEPVPISLLATLHGWLDEGAKKVLYAIMGAPGNEGAQKVSFNGKYFMAACPHTRPDRENTFRQAGWLRSTQNHVWCTKNADFALPFTYWMDGRARDELTVARKRIRESIEKSRATSSDFVIPAPPGKEYLPFQRAGIQRGLEIPKVLIGDDMGLGKTIQGIGIFIGDPKARRMLVVTLASLRLNWERELNAWLVPKDGAQPTVGVVKSGKKPFPDTDIVVINYNLLHAFENQIRAREWDQLTVDEAHLLKSPEARRTVFLLGGLAKEEQKGADGRKITTKRQITPVPAKRAVIMTGTPIPNRPVEVWPLLNYLDPEAFPRWDKFTERYCDAKKMKIKIFDKAQKKQIEREIMDVSGASNLEELQRILRSGLMVRRLKAEVLKDLPPKIRQVIELPADLLNRDGADKLGQERLFMQEQANKMIELRETIRKAQRTGNDAMFSVALGALRTNLQVSFEEISEIRKMTAVAKLPLVIDHIRNVLEEGEADNRKVVVFGHHKEVVMGIYETFADMGVKLIGSDSPRQRQAAVDKFQTDPLTRLFTGTMGAAGTGITLTASHHNIFAELDWNPALMRQSEDRTHRYGQTRGVLSQMLVLENSIEAKIARSLVRKLNVIDRALDRGGVDIADGSALALFEDVMLGGNEDDLMFDRLLDGEDFLPEDDEAEPVTASSALIPA